jgi:hypothetical protein
MSTTVTDEQIQALAATAKPYSLALLQWGQERTMDGADAIELEHQRRMVSLRAEGVIAILCPVASDTVAGVAIMTVPTEEAAEIMAGDPCVRAGMMRFEVHPCHGFPGDALPHERSAWTCSCWSRWWRGRVMWCSRWSLGPVWGEDRRSVGDFVLGEDHQGPDESGGPFHVEAELGRHARVLHVANACSHTARFAAMSWLTSFFAGGSFLPLGFL